MSRVVVAGGGIGGLTLAVALVRAGFDPLVVERASRFGDVGAGIQLGPHATGVLAELGLGDEVAAAGRTPAAVRFLRWADGRVLYEEPLTDARARYGAPYCTLYRPDLIALLAARLPSEHVRLGCAVTGLSRRSDGRVDVRLADGSVERADILVGADGIHSGVRSATVGDVLARFSGMSAYRAMLPADRLTAADLEVVRNWLGPDRHLVAYPVGRNPAFLNLVCVVPDAVPAGESWTAPGSVEVLRAEFAGWDPDLERLLAAVTAPVYRWALFDREPLPTWSDGVTTLLGDACHPMLPFLAQGAAQAIGDAAALTACLVRSPGDPELALRHYERSRREHTARVQRASFQNNVAYHLPDGAAQRERDAGFASVGNGAGLLDWLHTVVPSQVGDPPGQ
jgi:salicylate hydroxylase